MINLTLRKHRKIDEYEAIELLDCNSMEGQRKIKPRHLKMLCDEIEAGNFLTGSIAIAILTYDGNRQVLVNGQHQLTAVVKTGIPIVVSYEEYKCSTPNELSELYRRFDNHAARTLSDVLFPEAAALGLEWKQRVVELVVSAAAIKENVQHSAKIDKVSLLKKYIKEGSFINHIITAGRSARFMRRQSVALAMMETWLVSKPDAESFWIAVRDGANLPIDSPALKLRNFLLNTVTGRCGKFTQRGIASTDIASNKEIYVKCIHAWNAYRRGTNTNLSYHANAAIPKVA